MSAPADRLLSDPVVDRYVSLADAFLHGPGTLPAIEDLAAAVVLLARDRQARQEIAAAAKAGES